MPRPGPRREPVPLRLSTAERDPVDAFAEQETGGNLSEMIRILIAEALAARAKKGKHR